MEHHIGVKKLGVAIGITTALCMLVTGLGAWLFGWWLPIVDLVASFYVGFAPTFTGTLLGTVYGFVDGFIGGALIAWFYNKL